MKYEIVKLLFFRLIALILVVIGVLIPLCRLPLFLSSGVLLGVYYGWFNDIIWRPKGKLEDSLPYRAHQVWVHIICGIAGSIAFYLLVGVIDFNQPMQTVEKMGFGELMLFIVAILGYTGLLPRILWFSTYAQQNFK